MSANNQMSKLTVLNGSRIGIEWQDGSGIEMECETEGLTFTVGQDGYMQCDGLMAVAGRFSMDVDTGKMTQIGPIPDEEEADEYNLL